MTPLETTAVVVVFVALGLWIFFGYREYRRNKKELKDSWEELAPQLKNLANAYVEMTAEERTKLHADARTAVHDVRTTINEVRNITKPPEPQKPPTQKINLT